MLRTSALRALGIATAIVVVMVLASCGAPKEAEAPAADDGTVAARQLTGVWVPIGTFAEPAGPPPWQNTPWPDKPPFTAWGAAESARLADQSNFRPCIPTGPVFFMWEIGLFPLQFLEAPDQIVILREASGMPRRIYTDGRGHPGDLEPSWMGHTIGRWEGDVLVADTVGLNGKARAMNGVGANAQVSEVDAVPRMPSSERLHLVERFKLVANGELLEDEITVNDPKTYTAPIVVKHYFQRRPDIDVLEYSCGESPRDDHSFARFDRTKKVVLAGVVTDFQFQNPHAWIQLVVTDAQGKQTEWGIECGSPNMMVRTGWKKELLMAGDQVAVTVNPLLDGKPNGALVSITLASGIVLGPGDAPPPRPLGSGSAAANPK